LQHCIESWFYVAEQATCRLWVGEGKKKNSYTIFGVTDNICEYVIFQMAARISAALAIKLPEGQPAVLQKLIYCLYKLAVQYCSQSHNRKFFCPNTCACMFVLVRQIWHE